MFIFVFVMLGQLQRLQIIISVLEESAADCPSELSMVQTAVYII